MITISVILGSTRQGRFSETPAQWILQHLQKRAGIEARLLDLRDFPMPFFDQAVSPATPGRAPYENEVVKRWTAAIAASDGFVFVTPEYNYGPSAVLKNAIDWVYPEWNRKAAAFVSYGSAMGARSVQQLRETAIELQIAPVRSSVQIPVATLNYLAVRLKAGERWSYQPPTEHTVLWTAVGMGAVLVPDELQQGDLMTFSPSSAAIEFEAQFDAEFVLGSAVPHDRDLILSSHSVHTSTAALREAAARISAIQPRLIQQGRL